MKTKNSIKSYIYKYIIIALVLNCLLWFGVGYQIYKRFDDQVLYLVEDSAKQLENLLNDTFHTITTYLEFIGNQIINKGGDEASIEKVILENKYNYIINHYLMWTSLDWVNKNNFMVYDSIHGKIPPIALSSIRRYMSETKKNPWELFISDPNIGLISGHYCIPIGMGITNNQGIYLGTLASSISIKRLVSKIQLIMTNHDIIYSIIDVSGKFITAYPNSNIFTTKDINFLKELMNGGVNLLGTMSINYEFGHKPSNNYKFKTVKKLATQPIYVVVGYNRYNFIYKILSRLITPILCLLASTTMILITYRVQKKNIIEPINALSELASSSIETAYFAKNKFCCEIQVLHDEIMKLKRMNDISSQNSIANRYSQNYQVNTNITLNTNAFFGKSLANLQENTQCLYKKWKLLNLEDQYYYIEQINNTVQHLNQTSENIAMLLTKFKKIDGIFKNNNLHLLIQDIVNNFFKERKARIKYSFSKDLDVNIECDTHQMRLVFFHLIDNAIKFSSEKDEISIIAEEDRNHNIIIKIIDQGIGVPIGEEESIFEPFIKSSTTRLQEGTGLGLSLCRKILNDHGGNIFVKQHDSKTVFIVKLRTHRSSIENHQVTFAIKNGEEIISLSLREQDCVSLLIQGKTAKEIAQNLSISPRTVEQHINNMKIKAGAKYKSELLNMIITKTALEHNDSSSANQL